MEQSNQKPKTPKKHTKEHQQEGRKYVEELMGQLRIQLKEEADKMKKEMHKVREESFLYHQHQPPWNYTPNYATQRENSNDVKNVNNVHRKNKTTCKNKNRKKKLLFLFFNYYYFYYKFHYYYFYGGSRNTGTPGRMQRSKKGESDCRKNKSRGQGNIDESREVIQGVEKRLKETEEGEEEGAVKASGAPGGFLLTSPGDPCEGN